MAGTAVALPTNPVQPQQAQQGVQNPNATLVFAEQTSNGTTVRINTVTLSQGGFVTIHGSNLTANDSTVSSVIGVSERLSPGPHQDVVVRLYSVDGREFNRSALSKNGTLTAMAHFDSNDNREFDFVQTNGSVDGPYVEGTQAVVESANVSVRNEADDAAGGGTLGGIGPLVVTVGLVVVLALLVVAVVVARRRVR